MICLWLIIFHCTLASFIIWYNVRYSTLPTNNILGLQSLEVSNTLAYSRQGINYEEKTLFGNYGWIVSINNCTLASFIIWYNVRYSTLPANNILGLQSLEVSNTLAYSWQGINYKEQTLYGNYG